MISNNILIKHPTTVILLFCCIFASLSPPALAVHIEEVHLSRTPAVVSVNSFSTVNSFYIDGVCGLKVAQIYATVKIVNNGADHFTGFLRFEGERGAGYTVDIGPYETDNIVVPLPERYTPGEQAFNLNLETGLWVWEKKLIDTKAVSIQVKDTGSPTFPGPMQDQLGQWILFDTAVERNTPELADWAFGIGNFLCLLGEVATGQYVGEACFPGTREYSLLRLRAQERFQTTADVVLKAGLSEQFRRDLEIHWHNKSSSVSTGDDPDAELYLNYDRAVLTLQLPEEVGYVSSTLDLSLPEYVHNHKRNLVWLVNGVDKLIVPSPLPNVIRVRVSEPPNYKYSAVATLQLQFGPFENKDDFSDYIDKAPRYNYTKWETDPSHAIWLTVAVATREQTLSTKWEDISYNPLFTGFPYDRVPDYGATPQINLRSYINSDLPAEYVSQLWFDYLGVGNIQVVIDQDKGTADLIVPEGWNGQENVNFVVRDSEGRTDTATIWINPIIPTLLKDGSVSPESGNKDEIYTFSVTYVNPDNIYPKRSLVIINSIPHNMKMRPGGPSVKDGAIFEYKGKLSTTDNFFYFEFGDEMAKFRYPQSGVIEGPDIAEVHDIAIRNFSIYPETPEANDVVEVRAQIENLGTQLEPNIPVVFKVNNVVRDSHLINVSVEETSPVIVFTYQIPISDYTENYELKIEAGPVSGETSTADNVKSANLTIVPKPGAISGWVFDQWNNPVEGATVKVIESTVGDYGSTTSDSDGYYYLDGLKPTPEPEDYYTLEASKEGEGSAIRTNVAVHTRQTTENQIFNLYPLGITQVASGRNLHGTAWSPNGDKIAFVQTLGTGTSIYEALYRVNGDGSGLMRMTGPDRPAYDVVLGDPEFSPDGSKILFSATGTSDGKWSIWVTSANENGNDAYVVIPWISGVSWGQYPTWCPDGQRIAYVKVLTNSNPHQYKIYVYNTATHEDTYLKDGEYRNLAWSPDGRWIACDGFNYLINASTGEEVPISASFDTPCWLPDSSGVIYHSSWNIWLYYLDIEETVQITYDPEIEWHPSVPRNATDKLAFVSNKGFPEVGYFGLFVMPFSPPSLYFTDISAQPDPFTPNADGDDDCINISYSINKPAYVTLKIYDSQGNYVRTLLSNELQTAGSYASSWDGKNQEGNRENDEVYFYTLDMHDASGVAIPAHGRVGMLKDIRELASGAEYPRWSPSGDKIVYLKEEYDPKFGDQVNHIYICEANDFTNKQLVPTPFKVRPPRPDWSRDGSQIVFPSNSTGNQSQIAKINIDGTGYTEITTYTLGSLLGGEYPAWSPTEDKIVFSGVWNEPADNFWYITKINSDGSGLTKVGSWISRAQPQAPVWSPDGSKIAYAADKDGNIEIYLMNQDGSGEQKITNNPYTDIYPEFTSDGKRLLFGSNRHVGRGGSSDLWTQPLGGSDKPRCLAKGFGYGMPSLLGDKILVQNNMIDLFLSLTKGAIEGKIFEHETLEPIEDANVYVYQGGLLVGTTVTNEQGGYQFYNLEPGQYVLNAEAQGYIKSYDITVETHPWVVSRDNDIKLEHAPSAMISEISDGQKIGSVIAINTKREKGNVVSVKYQYRSQGGEWQDIATTLYPYPAEFDTLEPNLSSGIYQIRALAQDTLGNGDPSPSIINVEIDHTSPVAKITSPISGTKFTGTINIRAYCSDPDTDSVLFQYRKRGDVLWINIGSVDVETPWERSWKTDHLIEGEYELRAVGIDKLGNADDDPEIVTVTVKSNPADVNGNGSVDFADLAQLVGFWLTDEPALDIAPPGGDGKVNLLDFAEFANDWLEGTTP